MVNTMAAVLSALCLDVSIENILDGLKSFKNAPHRLELVGEVGGVAFINDSKATNVDAVYYALEGLKEGIVWIAGGVDKGNDYNRLKDLVAEKVRGIVCLGKDNEAIKAAFRDLELPIWETTKVKDAVKQAHQWAHSGEVVMLSPACASFDLFRNYEDRGDQFRMAVEKFKKTFKEKI